ncbi:unnamed protein product [Mytilus coruscus]|uniref:Fork-head domain-containing protein n=1 Tax=Mytilus coruscus TaxID=42192 RepID=A0A6J8EIN1_MYTCO|nr:unnamed protein product [Mytilus coruscus]
MYYSTRGDTERVKRHSISSQGDSVWTPSPCTNESSYSDSDKSIVQSSLDRSIKNGLLSHSYIAVISMAILSKPNKKLLLNDIYQYIMDNFPFYNSKGKAWRNSIRHNLSLNECFVKSGRSYNGKGNYWSIHLACVEDFAKGDSGVEMQKEEKDKKSVKTADGSSYKFNTRNNYGYVQLSLDRSIKNGISYSDTNEKPPHSYIAMISMAILSKPNKKMLLNDIYQYVIDDFLFYNNNEKAWRNSMRHNLSINECFVKSGRSENGKGNYWSIQLACIVDFATGHFKRRNAIRRAKKKFCKNFQWFIGQILLTE